MEYTREMFLWQQTFATLFAVSNKLQIEGDKYIERLTSRQLMTMIAIVHLPKGQASLSEIAKKLGTTKQNTKQLISAMEKKGYVIIASSESDKRAYNVEITESGKDIFIVCFNRGMEFFLEIFKSFSLNELETFWSYLKRLYRFDGDEQDGFEEPFQQ
ncbi:MAG: MarR family transcriptional regulator [Lacrimispora sp.]